MLKTDIHGRETEKQEGMRNNITNKYPRRSEEARRTPGQPRAAEMVLMAGSASAASPAPSAGLREPERSGTGSAPRWKMKCHCPAVSVQAQEGRQTRILRLVPVRMLDIRARRRKGRLRMGIDVIVVTPPWEVMAHEPPLLDVKMSQFLSDDAGKSVKGPSAGPSATPACVLSSDGGAALGPADSHRGGRQSWWQREGYLSVFLLPPLLKGAHTSLKGSLLGRRLGHHPFPLLPHVERETEATVGNDQAGGLTAGYLGALPPGLLRHWGREGALFTSASSVLSLRDPGSPCLRALPFRGSSESCILSPVSSQQSEGGDRRSYGEI